jgi:hypothetical protein
MQQELNRRESTEEKAGGSGSDSAEDCSDGEEARATVTVTLAVEDAWALEATRMVIERISGLGADSNQWFEWFVAEAQCTLMQSVPPGVDVADEDLRQEHEWAVQEQKAGQERKRRAEARAEDRVLRQREEEAGEFVDEEPMPENPVSLDGWLRRKCTELSSRDVWLGEMLAGFVRADGWRRLGYASDTQYARERLGMSRSSMYKLMQLATKSRQLEEVRSAVQDGVIGTEAAALITRVATERTQHAWIERAKRRTYKHLKEEVQMVELGMRLSEGRAKEPFPPTEAQVASYHALRTDVLSGLHLRRVVQPQDGPVQISGAGEREGGGTTSSAEAEPVQISGGLAEAIRAVEEASGTSGARHRAKVTLKLRVDPEVALLWRQVQHAYREAGFDEEQMVRQLCLTFWQTWAQHLGTSDKWEPIYARERYECSNPVCPRKNVTLHHLLFRAHGGTDHPDNLSTPCAWCHLEGIHGGRIKALPPASRTTWIVGRTPVIKIEGREKTVLVN